MLDFADKKLKTRLDRRFFNQNTLLVAQELLGKILVYGNYHGIITETEAYMGFEDPASHAFKGKTKRNEIMFGNPGFSYVYLIYGMYHCLNFVTEKNGYPAAVLIRGIQLISDNFLETSKLLNGPGKLCRHLGITRDQNGIDTINSNDLFIMDYINTKKIHYTATPRIGIKMGKEKLWRYIISEKGI